MSSRRSQTGRSQRWLTGLGAAAAIAILLAVLTGRPQAIETKLGERHTTALADGSRLELNARTSVAVDLDDDERHVRMVRGEALFTVAKDSARPFVVETPGGIVRVTGTVFNVRATADERMEVTVLEGSVLVRGNGASAASERDTPVTAGGQARLGNGSVVVRELPLAAAKEIAAWRQGQVVFENTPLAEAVERFAGYHERKIRIDADAADLRLGGRYGLDDLDGMLAAIERVLPVRVLHEESGAVRIVASRVGPK